MNSKSFSIFIILILYSFFLYSCIKKKEKVIPVPKPSHIPESAFQATDTESDWFYIDNSIGYYATWDKYGTLLTEIFLVNNLTEKIIKYYHDNGKPRRISTFKSFNNQKIPEDTIELADSEPENYKQRSEIRHLPNKFYTMNNNILHHLFETVEVLGEQIDIPEINLENFSWIKIKSKAIVGYIKKSNLTNKTVN